MSHAIGFLPLWYITGIQVYFFSLDDQLLINYQFIKKIKYKVWFSLFWVKSKIRGKKKPNPELFKTRHSEGKNIWSGHEKSWLMTWSSHKINGSRQPACMQLLSSRAFFFFFTFIWECCCSVGWRVVRMLVLDKFHMCQMRRSVGKLRFKTFQ